MAILDVAAVIDEVAVAVVNIVVTVDLTRLGVDKTAMDVVGLVAMAVTFVMLQLELGSS